MSTVQYTLQKKTSASQSHQRSEAQYGETKPSVSVRAQRENEQSREFGGKEDLWSLSFPIPDVST